MADFIVDTLSDVVDATDGLTSLREAIAFANTQTGADTIAFQAGLTGLLRLTQGEIEITDTVTIDGAGLVTITGDANGDDAVLAGTDITDVAASFGGTAGAADDLLDDNSRIFNITVFSADITLMGLTLTGGRTTAGGAEGGAIITRS